MAKTYDAITLLQEKEREIRKNGLNWMSFLKSSAYTNKYPYNDQILIYANKPDAKACGSMDLWNSKFHRWVNKGAKGIPLLDISDDGKARLRYVFDISDTHTTKYTVKDVNLWRYDEEQDNEALINIERRENISPEDSTKDIQYRVHEIAKHICEYEQSDLVSDMVQFAEDTYMEELDEFNISVMANRLLENSVAYQLMERMELSPEDYFEADDFADIINLNSSTLTSLISTTTSRITKDFLSDLSKEMSKTKTRQNNVQNTLINDQSKVYNENEQNKTKIQSSIDEGGIVNEDNDTGRSGIRSNERDIETSSENNFIREEWRNISPSGRDVSSEHRIDEQGTEPGGDLRQSKEEISGREQTGTVFSDDNRGNTSYSPTRSGNSSRETFGDADTTTSGSMGSDRTDESNRSDEVGGDDEQYQVNHRGNDLQRDSLQLDTEQLDLFKTEEEQLRSIEKTVEKESTVFSFYQSDIEAELLRGSGFANSKFRIYEFYNNDPTSKEAVEFLKKEYGVGGHSGSRNPNEVTSQSHDAKGIELSKGGYGDDRVDKLYTWSNVNKHIKSLIDRGLYLSSSEIDEYERSKHPDISYYFAEAGEFHNLGEYHEGLTFEEAINYYESIPAERRNGGKQIGIHIYDGDEFPLEVSLVDRGRMQLFALDYVRSTKDNPNVLEAISKLKEHFEPDRDLGEIDGLISGLEKQDLSKEPSKPEKIDFQITDYNLGNGTNNDKLNYNLDAIRTLKHIESENRLATKEEQEILSKYVGWGGLSHIFEEEPTSTWAMGAYGKIKRLLTDDEYKSARESTLNAHYTSPIIIEAMYDGLQMLGFKQGNVLEPSCGAGNFLGMVPKALNGSKFYGVELDNLTGRIAKQLYQNADIEINGFEETSVPDDFIDVAIGNVPFGDYKVYDKRYEKENFLIHDFFFAKTLDKVRPGGVVAFITSKGTLDKKSSNVRKYLAKRAELLSAIRLPNDAFKSNAGTEVTSDIIFLKKRERPIEIEPDWVHLGMDDNGISMNQYFVDHPEMIMGTMEMESTRFGMASTCKPIQGADLKEQLSEAIANITGFIDDVDIETYVEIQGDSIPADPDVRNFSFTSVDGELYFRENSVMVKPDIKDNDIPRIKGLVEIRDTTRELIRLQMEEYSDEEIREGQARLNEVYDRFVEKYGHINSKINSRLFGEDTSYALICSLENVDVEHDTVSKTDMFSKRTIKKREVPTHVDSAVEALAISIAEKAKVDMAYMTELTDLSEDDIANDLRGIIFKNPRSESNDDVEEYINADEYLSGNVRDKLQDAELAARQDPITYEHNVRALKEVVPKDLDATDIDVRLGATWMPPKDVEKFIFETLDTPGYAKWDIKVHYSAFSANWNVEGKSIDQNNIKANMTYGTDRVNAYKIIEDALNLRDTRVYDRVTDDEGKVKSVLNKHETMLAGQKQDALKEAFKSWIWEDPERRNRLVKTYNERFNSIRPREFDGQHIAFEGMNPSIQLREHQKNAIARTLYGGNTLLAHAVGAGKSFEMIASAMESKRLGLSQKSMFVVPNHLTEQIGSEFLKLYPSANILVATKKDFEPKNRKKFCGRIATGDYDAVIIGHSQFERIPMSVERQQLEFERQINSITQGIADLKAMSGERFSIKQLEKTKKSLTVRLQKLNDQSRKDDVVTFEELGVDKLIVDEAHGFKNLFLHTKMRNVAGIGQSEAKKSSDMFMKCRYMDEITNGKGVVFATGTPISNSMTELYTMQRYLQYGMLKSQNLEHFDAWASTFGETTTTIELSPEGTGYRPKTRFSKFYNLPELMNMFKEVADIKTADMLKLPVPEAEFETCVISPSDYQVEMVESLSERADMVRSKLVDSSVDNMLKITNDGRKLALDQRLMNPMLPRDENGKVAKCADNVFDVWDDTKENKSTQLVFCDLSTPKGNGDFNVYDDLKEQLMEKGVPEKEIAFIHDAKNERQKDELFARVRSGDIRVLIGSTQKMGAGTNVQDKLIATHDLDCPWKPADLEQRSGRLIRQGNENPKVKVFRYVTENTFDSYLWQLVENKQRFISQIMTSKSPVRSAEDVDESTLSYAEIKALATGNPLIKEKMDLDVQVSKLKMMHSNYLSNKYALEDKIIKYFPNEIKRLENSIKGYSADVVTARANTSEPTSGERSFKGMKVLGEDYTQLEKEEAGKALLSACREVKSGVAQEIGEYRGFKMDLSYDAFFNQFNLLLKGHISHRVVLGSDTFGNITRMDNILDNLDTKKETAMEKLEGVKQQLENARLEVKKPFTHDKELKTQTARLSELDNLLNMAESGETLTTVSELDKAKDYLIEFMVSEYDSDVESLDDQELNSIDIAYTTTEDEKHEIQARVDLENYTVTTYLDEVMVHQDKYDSLKDMNEFGLQHLDFESLISVDDVDIERVEAMIEEKLTIDKDTDLDGVIDRFDSDSRDSNVMTNGDLDEREKTREVVGRPSLLGQLKKNRSILEGEVECKTIHSKKECYSME